jgi:hypothetical protein
MMSSQQANAYQVTVHDSNSDRPLYESDVVVNLNDVVGALINILQDEGMDLRENIDAYIETLSNAPY